jgi:hypothetical protein
MRNCRRPALLPILGHFAAALLLPAIAAAHCDSLDGPVVRDARVALEAGDAAPVLKWVAPEQEAEVLATFQKTLTVRGKGTDAKELADLHFFETLVRLHRAGEGEPYTGLKPAGSTQPGLAAADDALAAGSSTALAKELSVAIERAVNERFAIVNERARHAGESVEAGRDYVEAYVEYAHFVESVHTLVARGAAPVHHAD